MTAGRTQSEPRKTPNDGARAESNAGQFDEGTAEKDMTAKHIGVCGEPGLTSTSSAHPHCCMQTDRRKANPTHISSAAHTMAALNRSRMTHAVTRLDPDRSGSTGRGSIRMCRHMAGRGGRREVSPGPLALHRLHQLRRHRPRQPRGRNTPHQIAAFVEH